ncbi:MAG: sugar phosphate nucleotidyltransferase [Nitrososphaerota archaeon]
MRRTDILLRPTRCIREGLNAVILAAGEGRRLDPLTRNRPKPLLPVAGEPLIHRIVRVLSGVGVDEACVVTSPSGDRIMDALRGVETPHLRRAVQDRPLGTAHALLAAGDFVRDEEKFILVYGDLFFEAEALQGLVAHVATGFDGGVLAIRHEEARRFGVLLEEDGVLKGIVEKPEHLSAPALINSGVYVLPGEIVEAAEKIEPSIRREYELTDAITLLVKSGRRIAVYKHPHGYWLDVGTPASYLEANLLALREYQPPGLPQAPALQHSYIGGEVRLGRHSQVRSSVLMEDVEVGEDVTLDSVVLLEKAVVERGAQLAYAIVGENGRAGRGCILRGLRERPVVIGPGSAVPPYFTAGPGDVF